jgi:hypothetical protein
MISAKSDSYNKYVSRCRERGEPSMPRSTYLERKNELIEQERTFGNAIDAGFILDAARQTPRMVRLRKLLWMDE